MWIFKEKSLTIPKSNFQAGIVFNTKGILKRVVTFHYFAKLKFSKMFGCSGIQPEKVSSRGMKQTVNGISRRHT